MSGQQSSSHFHQPARYHSYLLRLWRSAERKEWRVTLQGIERESQIHFENLDQFVDFLRQLLQSAESE